MKTTFILPVALLLSGFMALSACTQNNEGVQLKSGLITGISESDAPVRAYLGIPFAAPPVGDLRWKAPQPVVPWEGVRAADELPDACIQNLARTHLPNGPWTEEFMHQGEISEDCLYLNVWTPATSSDEKLPVMVYIYGGGFGEGSNAISLYNGEELAKKGVVQVGINYRVGILGFFAHPDLTAESDYNASGNYGLLDQVAALQWVQDNIAAFGGDPDQVTIFGQSAGAMSVSMLMHSPLAEGLFTRAIIQSGPGLFPINLLSSTLSQAEEGGVQFAEAKGASSLAALRALTPDQLMEPVEGAPRFGPNTDGYYLVANRENKQVPVMNGFTAEDLGAGGGGFGPPPEPTLEAYENDARRLYGDKADTFLSLYPARSDDEVPALHKTSGQDRARVSLFLWATDQMKRSDSIYTYYFDRAIPWPEHPEFGAFHTGEIPYVFNNLHLLERPWEPVDHTIADQMSSYWTNFAITGDPNGTDLPTWYRFTPDHAVTMQIGARMGEMAIADPAKVQFWTEILRAQSGSM